MNKLEANIDTVNHRKKRDDNDISTASVSRHGMGG